MAKKISIIEEKMKEIMDVVFPSKEDDGVEAIDMWYTDFIEMLEDALKEVYKAGKSDSK